MDAMVGRGSSDLTDDAGGDARKRTVADANTPVTTVRSPAG
ncbi:hypothetical protein [Haloarchaeobius sp. DFWS5]